MAEPEGGRSWRLPTEPTPEVAQRLSLPMPSMVVNDVPLSEAQSRAVVQCVLQMLIELQRAERLAPNMSTSRLRQIERLREVQALMRLPWE